MDNDDVMIGRVLTRREAVQLLGAVGLAALVGCGPEEEVAQTAVSTPTQSVSTAAANTAVPPTTTLPDPTATLVEAAAHGNTVPTCVVRPALTEGPYFVDERLNRSDIRSDPTNGSVVDGAPLLLTFNVSQITAGGCTAFPSAIVDIWHCDARGIYSDANDRSFNTVGQKFLRGYQETDANGQAQFLTIYPGWYNGRAVHIHFKIRSSLDDAGVEFTSQLFFDEDYTDQVYQQEPYASTGQRTILNSQDGIYQQSGGQLTLNVAEGSDGYVASFDIGLDMT
ncbi:MAG: intradiol ring-cleavage dioxygenase [Anaerolineaceae bacterium]|nr:intradiol ring-cleavage dioxygenase [Anaerolineaceae bacterium]